MKRILILPFAVLALACNQKGQSQSDSKNITEPETEVHPDFDWLTGNWKRLNDEAGRQTFENWHKVNATTYSGISYTMFKGDTISQEQMSLIESDGKWSLLVKTPDEREPVTFEMTEHSKKRFVCKNDLIDFPKRIEYSMEGEKLKAKVSGEKTEIPFEFKKIK